MTMIVSSWGFSLILLLGFAGFSARVLAQPSLNIENVLAHTFINTRVIDPALDAKSESNKAFSNAVLADEDAYLVIFSVSEHEACASWHTSALKALAAVERSLVCRTAIVNASLTNLEDHAYTLAATHANVDLKKIAKEVKTAVDAGEEPTSCGAAAYFPFGDNKEEVGAEAIELNESTVSGKQLIEFAAQHVDNLSSRVQTSMIEQFLRSDVQVPKAILITKGKETPEHWKALSVAFRGAITFIDAKGDDRTKDLFKHEKLPWIGLAFSQTDPETGTQQMSVQNFPGTLSNDRADYIAQFLLEMSAALQMQGSVQLSGKMEESFKKLLDLNEVLSGKKGQPLKGKVSVVSTKEEFNDACVEQNAAALCLVAFVKPSASADADADADDADAAGALDEETMKEIKLASSKSAAREEAVTYIAVDASKQPSFASAFGISSSDVPTAVILHPRKKVYVPMPSQNFNKADELNSFVIGVLTGKARGMTKLDTIPEPVDGGEALQVEDAPSEPEEVLEDEFDLSELMGEDVGAGGSREEMLRKAEEELKQEQAREAEEAAAAAAAAKAAKEEEEAASKKKKSKKSKKSKKKSKKKSDKEEL